MRPLTPEQQDALEDAIARQLYRINNHVTGMFGAEMSDNEIRRAHARISSGVRQQLDQQEGRSTSVMPNDVIGKEVPLTNDAQAYNLFSVGNQPMTGAFGDINAGPERGGDVTRNPLVEGPI